MELPITVIVVLFVALVVGGVIVGFSQQSLNRAQQGLEGRLPGEDIPEDDIVRVSQASETTVLALARECIERKRGSAERDTCFALFAGSMPSFPALDGRALPDNFVLNTSAAPANASAVMILYDPVGQVKVTG